MIIKTLRNIEQLKTQKYLKHVKKCLKHNHNPQKKPAKYVYAIKKTLSLSSSIFTMIFETDTKRSGVIMAR